MKERTLEQVNRAKSLVEGLGSLVIANNENFEDVVMLIIQLEKFSVADLEEVFGIETNEDDLETVLICLEEEIRTSLRYACIGE